MNNLNLKVIIFLFLWIIISVIGLFYLSPSFGLIMYFIAIYTCSVISINLGWHRFFSHKSFNTNKLVQSIFLFFGSSAFFGKINEWIKEHRDHHSFLHTDKDPQKSSKNFIQRAYWMCWKTNPDTSKISSEYNGFIFNLINDHSFLFSLVANVILIALGSLLLEDKLLTIIWMIGFLRVCLVFNLYTLTHACGHNSFLGFLHYLNLGEGDHESHHLNPRKIDECFNITSVIYRIGRKLKVFY